MTSAEVSKKYNISNEDKLMYSRVDRLAQSYQHFINTYCDGNKNIVLDQMKDWSAIIKVESQNSPNL